jgi:hypothetical protein
MTIDINSNITKIELTIENLNTEIKKLEESIKFSREEILRLEGCRIVYDGLKKAGVTKIDTEKDKPKRAQKIECDTEKPEEIDINDINISDDSFRVDYNIRKDPPVPNFLKECHLNSHAH